MTVIKFLAEINKDSNLAASIAMLMMIGIIVFCSTWLIIKKLLLNKKYHADEQFVKEYKQKLKEQEELAVAEQKPSETIKEDF